MADSKTAAPLTLLARLTAASGKEAALESVLKTLTVASKAEPGNVGYDLHRSRKNPAEFLLVEIWKDDAALAVHHQEPHFLTFRQSLQEQALLAEPPEVTEWTGLSPEI